MELIPGLPEEIGVECLMRLHYTGHHAARCVCRRWKETIDSRNFYHLRKQSGNTHTVACLVQHLPVQIPADGPKPIGLPAYGVTVFDPEMKTWDRLEPIPCYPDGLPLFCQLVGVEGKLVVMGGWDPASWNPVRHVFVYDFTQMRWRRGQDMPAVRSFFAAGAVGGRVIVAGGHDENKNALRSASAYNVRSDEWEEVAEMGEERDECEGVVVNGAFWAVSGYGTESQGSFKGCAEVYEFEKGRWGRVEGAWVAGRCPRARVRVSKEGGLVCWAGEEVAVRVGACGVGLGERWMASGAEYQGAPPGFFLVDTSMKFDRLDVPDQFSGFVQSGCCIDI